MKWGERSRMRRSRLSSDMRQLEYLLATPFVRLRHGRLQELVECHVVVDGRVVAGAHRNG